MTHRASLIAAALILAPIQAPSAAGAEPSIEEWLLLVGWDANRLAAAADENPRTQETRDALLELARRFRRLPDRLKQATVPQSPDSQPLPPGTLVELTGHATGVQPLPGGFKLLVEPLGNQPAATVLTPAAPSGWLKPAGQPLNEPASLRGIAIVWNANRRLVVTPRVAWRPTSAKSERVNLGAALLGQAGMDVGLLDQLADGKPLTAADAQPFYGSLAACKRYRPGQLVRVAGENLPAYAARWEEEQQHAGPRRSLADTAANRARNGHYSVAPLFNDSERQRGRLAAFEGTVRRAVRIDLTTSRDGGPSRVPEQHGLDHYFELELFTADSQNLPLVFCVLDLPEGFPLGDAIQQRARLAGFFLKRWAYRTRKPTGPGGDRRQLAPLLVGPGPVWLASGTPPRNYQTSLLAGVGFIGVVAIVAVALWRQSRADRRFERSVLSRYTTGDAPRRDNRS